MIAAIRQLESRKLRSAVIGCLVMLLVCYFTSVIFLGLSDIATTGKLMAPMIALVAMVLGASSAYGLRKDPEKSSEEFMPVKPERKVFASYRVSLIFLLILFSISVLFCNLETTISLGAIGETGFWLFAGIVFDLHLLSFVFCYWWKQPVSGSGLAFVIVGINVLLLVMSSANINDVAAGAIFIPKFFADSFWLINILVRFLTIVCGIYLAIVALKRLVNKIDRGATIKLTEGVLYAALILLPALFPLFSLACSSYLDRIRSVALLPANYGSAIENGSCCEISGTVLMTQKGTVLHVNKSGQKQIIFAPTNAMQILRMEIDDSHVLWVLGKYQEGGYEVLEGPPDNPLQHYTSVDGNVRLDLLKTSLGKVFLRKTSGYQSQSSSWLKSGKNVSWSNDMFDSSFRQNSNGPMKCSPPAESRIGSFHSVDGLYYVLDQKIYLMDESCRAKQIGVAELKK
jgi:hypothetical protein